MSAVRSARLLPDLGISLLAGVITASGSVDTIAAWLPRNAIVPLAAAQAVMLLARRRAPTAVLAGTAAVGVVMIAAGYPNGSAMFGACCAAYAVAVYHRGDESTDLVVTLRYAAIVALAALAFAAASTAPGPRDRSGIWGAPLNSAFVFASWVLGYAVRTRRAYIAELKARAARLEAEEGERAARAVIDERLRIARELHDVIGHSISLISIQAEAATRAQRTNPDAVPGFLARISAASRQTLAEMRHVLAVLRPDAGAELSPQPGLADLDELVARLNAGGLRTRLEVEPMDLSPGVALTVYRIVQESLTNVLKHAGPGATATVTVARGGNSVRVSVHDDGTGPSGPALSTAHGIIGMHERAAAYGGTLRTGAGARGGFEVEALIPIREEAP